MKIDTRYRLEQSWRCGLCLQKEDFFLGEFESSTVSEIPSESFRPEEGGKGHCSQLMHVRMPLSIYKWLMLGECKIKSEVRKRWLKKQNKFKGVNSHSARKIM